MRPRSLDEVVGQQHLTSGGSPLRKLTEHDSGLSVLLWGPPGTGKTTLAYVVSRATRRRFVELSAVSAGVKDVRAAIDAARRDLDMTGSQTILLIDEVHRFDKAQQDALLPAVENRWVSFILSPAASGKMPAPCAAQSGAWYRSVTWTLPGGPDCCSWARWNSHNRAT